MENKEFFIKQLESLEAEFNEIKSVDIYMDLGDTPSEKLSGLITKSKAAISRISGKNSEYYKDTMSILNGKVGLGIKARRIAGVINALLSDIKNDYLQSFTELIHANIFSDFIEMSEYLSKEGYKDASAVIIGSTLESHLRKLCIKNKIPIEIEKNNKIIPKNADVMNSELTKKEVYNKIFQKQITASLGIRNNAAHGKYEGYTLEQVKLMIQEISNFINSNPA